MDYYTIIGIMETLKEINPGKAKKLGRLVEKYLNEKDKDKKKNFEKKIRNFIFATFLDCLDRDLKNELYNLCSCINADRYDIESRDRSWFINSEGAHQYKVEDGEFIEISSVPREFERGFYLRDDATDVEKNFYMKNHALLTSLSEDMDRKEEIITYYQPKNSRIPREFTETLVDYIGFKRIESEENKKATTK